MELNHVITHTTSVSPLAADLVGGVNTVYWTHSGSGTLLINFTNAQKGQMVMVVNQNASAIIQINSPFTGIGSANTVLALSAGIFMYNGSTFYRVQ